MDRAKPKYYVLEMFPYPSGRIHMGHVRNYTMGDVVARYKRAKGFNVLHPMGWDAFGLPAENAAMERRSTRQWTYENIATMKAPAEAMGLSLDWSRELATCDPGYYRHQQKMFLDFYKAGLAYRKEALVNWDPVDHTVLANEQVIEGKGWRSGAPVERRKLAQWFLKITHFADELLEALDTLDRWPEKVRLMQANWIGKSRGARVFWQLDDASGAAMRQGLGKLEIFTTRPDTLYGASFLALSPDHPLVAELAAKRSRPAALHRRMPQDRHRRGRDRDRRRSSGYKLPLLARHPLMPGKTMPVYVANFVLMEYGTGAIFGCPGHDQRDHEFAQQVRPADPARGDARRAPMPESFSVAEAPFVEDGVDHQFRFPGRPRRRGRQGEGDRAAGGDGRRQGHDAVPPARLAGVAPALLGLPDPGDPLRQVRHRAGAGEGPAGGAAGRRHLRQAGQSARPPSDLEARRLPELRRPARRETDTFDTFVEFELVLRALHARPAWRPRRSTARRTTTGCRSTSISAASSTRSCTCSIRASARARCARSR